MNRIVQIKVFNDILDQFLSFLEINFPLFKSDIMLAKSTTEFIRNSNPRLVVEQFMGIVKPYTKQIFNCNEEFFLDFEKNLSVSSENLLSGVKIRKMWISDEITETHKAYIWMYFQKLIKAGEKVMQ
jgi:hypothetical protein